MTTRNSVIRVLASSPGNIQSIAPVLARQLAYLSQEVDGHATLGVLRVKPPPRVIHH